MSRTEDEHPQVNGGQVSLGEASDRPAPQVDGRITKRGPDCRNGFLLRHCPTTAHLKYDPHTPHASRTILHALYFGFRARCLASESRATLWIQNLSRHVLEKMSDRDYTFFSRRTFPSLSRAAYATNLCSTDPTRLNASLADVEIAADYTDLYYDFDGGIFIYDAPSSTFAMCCGGGRYVRAPENAIGSFGSTSHDLILIHTSEHDWFSGFMCPWDAGNALYYHHHLPGHVQSPYFHVDGTEALFYSQQTLQCNRTLWDAVCFGLHSRGIIPSSTMFNRLQFRRALARHVRTRLTDDMFYSMMGADTKQTRVEHANYLEHLQMIYYGHTGHLQVILHFLFHTEQWKLNWPLYTFDTNTRDFTMFFQSKVFHQEPEEDLSVFGMTIHEIVLVHDDGKNWALALAHPWNSWFWE